MRGWTMRCRGNSGSDDGTRDPAPSRTSEDPPSDAPARARTLRAHDAARRRAGGREGAHEFLPDAPLNCPPSSDLSLDF